MASKSASPLPSGGFILQDVDLRRDGGIGGGDAHVARGVLLGHVCEAAPEGGGPVEEGGVACWRGEAAEDAWGTRDSYCRAQGGVG